jgi:hypothetical protein
MKNIEIQGETAADRNSWLRNLLVDGVYDVTFTKVNGEIRTMPCTLKRDLLPPMALKETATEKVNKTETLGVWCMDKQEWRSFRVMNVTEVIRL